MSNLGPFLGCLLFTLACLLVSVSSEATNSRQTVQHVAMFFFGDSIYDPGNNDYINVTVDLKSNRWPYGESFFELPTGRFCNGRILPDFTAMNANLPLWTPYLQPGTHNFSNGANFASAGSGVLPATNPGTIDLEMQLSYFKEVADILRDELGKEEAKKLLMEAVYLSSSGGNDYVSFYSNYSDSTESDQIEYVKEVIGNLTNVIKKIYEIGGRKFVFQNVGPVGCLPLVRQSFGMAKGECVEELLTMARLHNSALLQVTEELQSQLQGFKYTIIDFYTSLFNIITNPSAYGFAVSDVACCGAGIDNGSDCGLESYELCSNPSEYVFWDGAHPTETVNAQLINIFWNGDPAITKPYSLKQLFELHSYNISENSSLFNDE